MPGRGGPQGPDPRYGVRLSMRRTSPLLSRPRKRFLPSSNLQVRTSQVTPREFRIEDPADLSPGIDRNFVRLDQIVDRRLERLIHGLSREMRPHRPAPVFAAVLSGELFDHADGVEGVAGTADRRAIMHFAGRSMPMRCACPGAPQDLSPS